MDVELSLVLLSLVLLGIVFSLFGVSQRVFSTSPEIIEYISSIFISIAFIRVCKTIIGDCWSVTGGVEIIEDTED